MRFVAVAMLAVFFSPFAQASRPADASEARAVKRAVTAFVAAPKSPAAKDNRVVSIRISGKNPSYALAKLSSKSAGPSNALVHRRSSTWKVIDFGSGAFPCKDASVAILKDLLGGCAPS